MRNDVGVELSSVRELKQELTEPVPHTGGIRPQVANIPAERASDVARVQPAIALGVAPGRRSNDYRLAVRIQSRDFLSGSRINAITRAARNEVDIDYIGLPIKRSSRQRPIHPGVSVGHYKITAGTLGAIVRVGIDGKARILSNNHVLADENRAAPGDEILQPGVLDGGQVGQDRVAILDKFVRLTKNRANKVDAALAVVDSNIDFDPSIPNLGRFTEIVRPENVINVAKLGRTTGLTRGRVTAIEVDAVAVRFSTGILRFDGQIEISGTSKTKPFSDGGDSGSLIVDPRRQAAVGLLFAGSDQGGANELGVTYATPLDVVFDQLGVAGLL